MGKASLMTGRRLGAKLLVVFFVVFSASLFNIVGNAQDSFAADCPESRPYCNSPERVAGDACNAAGYSGAMWFNTSDDSPTTTGYYSATVNINATADTVRVNLRGSVNSCGSSNNGNTVYALEVGARGPNGGRLTNLSSQSLNRGTVPNASYSWSSKGGSIGADLNVSGLATNNSGQQDSQSITIDIYRCFSSDPDRVNGGCYATPVEVNVVRDAGPNFDLTPTISGTPQFIEGGTTEDSKVVLAPSVRNSGTTTSSSADWRVVAFTLAPGAGIPGGNTNTSDPEQYFRNSARSIGSSSNAFGTGVTNLSVAQQDIGDLPIGTRVCYALSVKPVTQSYSGWRHSAPFCVTVGKSPKVQILGNDLMVGRKFAGATGAVPTSSIQTSVTKKATQVASTIAPQSAFSGLWETGVNNAGQKLGQNAADPHWNLDRIMRPPSKTGNTCQQAVGSNGSSLIAVPTTSANPRIAPRTITENGDGTKAGYYSTNNRPVTGDWSPDVQFYSGQYVWSRTSSSARWISQNMYGQNYSNLAGCTDPTFYSTGDMDNANIYVFKLDNGFTIDPNAGVDLDSARINIKGGVDNRIKFIVNGQELGDWQTPGWAPGAQATSTNKNNVFKNGQNSLEVWVQSTSSHTGLLIDEITIQATSQVRESKVYGSWSEYAATATGSVQGIGSGSAYAGGIATQTICGASLMTLSNTPNTSACSSGASMGGYRTNRTMPDVAGAFATNSSITLPSTTSLTGLNGTYKAPGNLTITGGTIAPGRSVVINAPGSTVTIADNITYSTGGMNSVDNIPQVVIIAGAINILSSVTQIDSWLIASGTLNTCSDVGNSVASLTIGVCGARLTVNGPVMAGRLLLLRTAGSGSGDAASDPAEVFNLRPDAYLWGISQSSKSGRLETVFERELPPRF